MENINNNNSLNLKSAHLMELLNYWLAISPGGLLPGRTDIDPTSIPHILPYCLLIDVHFNPLDFEYRLLGTKIDEISRRNHTGFRVSEISTQKPPSLMYDLYLQVTDEKVPARIILPYIGDRPRLTEVEILALPLASNGRDVDKIFGGIALMPETRAEQG